MNRAATTRRPWRFANPATCTASSPPGRLPQARVLAAQGDTEAAVALAREAAALRAGDDDLTGSAETFVDLAEVLEAAGDRPGAVAALEEAIGLHEEKGNVVAAAQCRERLTAIA